jgi:uncharacterized membrane protein
MKGMGMDLVMILQVVAVVSAGLLAGIFVGYRAGVHYAVAELSPSSFVQLQQIIHVHYVSFMPPLVLAAVLSSVWWLVMVRSQWRMAEFWLVAIAACGLIVSAAATRAVNIPLNNQLMTWSVAAPPTDLRERWAPWERVNNLRSVLAAGALVLEAVALSLKAASGR